MRKLPLIALAASLAAANLAFLFSSARASPLLSPARNDYTCTLGAQIGTGSVDATLESGVTISGLTVGNWYAVGGSGYWWSGANYEWNFQASNNGGTDWSGSNLGRDHNDHYNAIAPVWGVLAELSGGNHARFYWQATTTSIRVHVYDAPGQFANNTGEYGYILSSASCALPTPTPNKTPTPTNTHTPTPTQNKTALPVCYTRLPTQTPAYVIPTSPFTATLIIKWFPDTVTPALTYTPSPTITPTITPTPTPSSYLSCVTATPFGWGSIFTDTSGLPPVVELPTISDTFTVCNTIIEPITLTVPAIGFPFLDPIFPGADLGEPGFQICRAYFVLNGAVMGIQLADVLAIICAIGAIFLIFSRVGG